MLKKLLNLDPTQEVDSVELAFRGVFQPLPDILQFVITAVLVVASIGFAIFLYHSEKNLPKARRIAMTICQAAALLVLILIIMRPYAKIRTTKDFRRNMLVMLDTSRSMAIEDPRHAPAEIEEAAKALNKFPLDGILRGDDADSVKQGLGPARRIDLARSALEHPDIKLIEQLKEKYDVRFFTFDGQLRPEAGTPDENEEAQLARREAKGESSQLGSALEEAVARFNGQPVAGAVVISDFAWVEGKDPLRVARQLKDRDIPVHTVPVGLPAPPDIHVRGVVAPEVVFKGDRVPLRVKVDSRGFAGRTVELVLKIDGQRSTSQPVELADGVQFQEMMFIPQRESGNIQLDFEIASLAGETTDLNNSTSHQVRIIDEKIQVLYVEGMPRWEYRYLRWVLLRDPRLNVKFLMTQGDPALAGSSPNHIGRFPQDPQEALKYDLIILGDVPASYFNTAQTDLIHKLINERGGSLLMIAGPMAAPSTYRDTPIGDLLPVHIGTGGYQTVAPGDSPQVTPAGQASLATSLSLTPETSNRIWSHVRPMFALPQLGGAKAGATVLLRLPKANDQLPDYPLVAWHRHGTGKSMFVATEDLWRMRLEVGDRFHARFWGQTIQFLTLSRLLGANKQIQIETDRNTFSTGEQVRIFANVLTESFEPVLQESYEVVLEAKDDADSATTIELPKVPGSPGQYSATHLAGKDGSYVVRTRAQDAEVSNRAEFVVATEPIEDRETAMAPEVARQIAEISGGQSLTLASLGGFPATLGQEEKLTNVVRNEQDLWDVPIWFLLIVAFAGAEWYLRRKDNLV